MPRVHGYPAHDDIPIAGNSRHPDSRPAYYWDGELERVDIADVSVFISRVLCLGLAGENGGDLRTAPLRQGQKNNNIGAD